MTKRFILAILRLAFGSLTLAAIGIQLAIQVHLGFSVVNFFSFFTNLSNLFAAVILIRGGLLLAGQWKPYAGEDLIRGGAAVNMAVVGIIFTLLLRDADLGALLPWVNLVLHYVMPVAVVLEWLFQPPRIKLVPRQMLLWQAFPLLYVTYVLIRGAKGGWYPYPFLNPAIAGGYGAVAAYILGIVVVFFLVSWSLLVLGNKLGNKRYGNTTVA